MTVYIENEKGGVHSVSDEHYATYLTTRGVDGGLFPLPGITVLKEPEARKKNPELFGQADPNVSYTDQEIVARLEYQERLAKFRELQAANNLAANPEV